MQDHDHCDLTPRLPLAPENIYEQADGRYLWFDGREFYDVTDHAIWWKCPRQESIASRCARQAGAPCCEAT